MIRTYINRGVLCIRKISTFELSIGKQCPLKIRAYKSGICKDCVTKVHLFRPTLPHHYPLQRQAEKVAVIEDALSKSQEISAKQTLPIPHRPIDSDHLARQKINIAQLGIGQFHHTHITVYKTAFDKLAREKKGLTEIAGDKGAILEFRLGDFHTISKFIYSYL